MIKSLGTPDVTPALKQTIVEGVLADACSSLRQPPRSEGERAAGATVEAAGGGRLVSIGNATIALGDA
jgi:hypothetical protein